MSLTALLAPSQHLPLRAALTIAVTLPCGTLAPRGMLDFAETAVFLPSIVLPDVLMHAHEIGPP